MDLKTALFFFADIDEKDFSLAETLFTKKLYKKGQSIVVKDKRNSQLGYISKGLIRSYYIEPETRKEKNLFFFQERQFLSSLLVFTHEGQNNYYLETLEDSEVYQINQKDLLHLYNTSHKWERFGRFLAEEYYRGANERTESFIFQSPEERYLKLIKTFPTIFQRTSLIHISSYLGIESQSLSRIKSRLTKKSSE